MAASNFPHFIVINGEQELAGILTLRDLRGLLGPTPQAHISWASPASALMKANVITVQGEDTLEKAFDLFAHYNFSFLPVISDHNPRRILGILKKSDLVAAYDQQILKDQILPHASWFFPLKGNSRREK